MAEPTSKEGEHIDPSFQAASDKTKSTETLDSSKVSSIALSDQYSFKAKGFDNLDKLEVQKDFDALDDALESKAGESETLEPKSQAGESVNAGSEVSGSGSDIGSGSSSCLDSDTKEAQESKKGSQQDSQEAAALDSAAANHNDAQEQSTVGAQEDSAGHTITPSKLPEPDGFEHQIVSSIRTDQPLAISCPASKPREIPSVVTGDCAVQLAHLPAVTSTEPAHFVADTIGSAAAVATKTTTSTTTTHDDALGKAEVTTTTQTQTTVVGQSTVSTSTSTSTSTTITAANSTHAVGTIVAQTMGPSAVAATTTTSSANSAAPIALSSSQGVEAQGGETQGLAAQASGADAAAGDASSEVIQQALLDLAVESWRFINVFERMLTKIEGKEQTRYQNQKQWFVRKLNESLNKGNFRFVDLTNQVYEPGMAITPINLDEFSPEDTLKVERMLEPVIMQNDKLLKMGTVSLIKDGE